MVNAFQYDDDDNDYFDGNDGEDIRSSQHRICHCNMTLMLVTTTTMIAGTGTCMVIIMLHTLNMMVIVARYIAFVSFAMLLLYSLFHAAPYSHVLTLNLKRFFIYNLVIEYPNIRVMPRPKPS